jgi:hypothetical protein
MFEAFPCRNHGASDGGTGSVPSLVNMAILRTKINPIMENKTRNFEQKLAKIAKAGAANTPLPHDNYWNSTPSYLRRRQNHFFLRGLRVLLFKIFSSPCRTKE